MSQGIVIIGGGISGVATSYELAVRGFKPILLEKGELAAMASGWTLGGVRQSGRHPAELPLARAAVHRWPSLEDELEGPTHYRQRGNVRIARHAGEADRILEVVASTQNAGIPIEYLPTPREVQSVAPAVAPTIHSGSFCPSDGHADPIATVTSYAAAAERHGATIRTGVSVEAVETTGGRVSGLRTSEGPVICDQVIVAAGVFTPQLLEPIGIAFPLQVGIVSAFQSIPVQPLLDQVLGVATGTIAARQEVDGCLRLTGGRGEWAPGLDSLKSSNDSLQPTPVDLSRIRDLALEILPVFDNLRIRRIWGGLIDQSADALPVYSNDTGIDGLCVAAGFSGHGFGIGPVTGQIMADLATGAKPSFDLAPFALDRFAGTAVNGGVELHG